MTWISSGCGVFPLKTAARDAIGYRIACPIKRWNYEYVTVKTVQKKALTFLH